MHELEGIEISPSWTPIFQRPTRVQLQEIENSIYLNYVSRRKRGYAVCRGKELASDLPRVCSTI